MVTGRDFLYSDDLGCEFGSTTPTRAKWLSSSRLKCVAPAHIAGNVSLVVRNFGQPTEGADAFGSIMFQYMPKFNVTSISPTSGVSTGGTIVTVAGVDFPRCVAAAGVSCWWCHFGPVAVAAQYKSSTSLECATPPHQAGFTTLQVFHVDGGGERVPTAGVHTKTFEFTAPPIPESLMPRRGLMGGGAMMLLSGSNLPGPETLCVFNTGLGTQRVRATMRSSNEIGCTTPVVPSGHVSVGLVSSDVTMAPSSNTTGAVLTFTSQPMPTITSTTPRFGPIHGGTIVTIHGSNFQDRDGVMCKFGSVSPTRATWLDSLRISCRSPAHHSGNTTLAVTDDLGSYQSEAVTFEYIHMLNMTHIVPQYGDASGGYPLSVRHTPRVFPQK
jgi:hypothetical protein